ncbi:MAG: 2Fe-2S iron-sulfur cluster binding domain-containing protein [Bacteriovoracaceae bacterium]|nr:2Fe-2S iron-sulfur cluster binding domain-containing protein [Bacteriovoracaceae bacterium]
MYKLNVSPSGECIEIDGETNVKQALSNAGIYLKATCGGEGACGECVIKVLSGEDHLTPPGFLELSRLGNVFHITKERLACMTTIEGDITIDIADHLEAPESEKDKTDNSKKKLKTVVRSKDDVKQMYVERDQKRAEKQEVRDNPEKHWKEEKDPMRFKKLGGGKRPKAFKDAVDYENRPLRDTRRDDSRPQRDSGRDFKPRTEEKRDDTPSRDGQSDFKPRRDGQRGSRKDFLGEKKKGE